jgi:2'-5' RNA ligase
MQRFNIALIPVDENLQLLFQSISQKYFGKHHDQYLLANGALAHVTLCQFYAEDKDGALAAFQSFSAKKNINITIRNYNIRSGRAPHIGFFWTEFVVDKTPTLLQMQAKCFSHLAAMGHESLTAIDTYAPHITLARLGQHMEIRPSEDIPYGVPLAFRPVVGPSTENGVLQNSF